MHDWGVYSGSSVVCVSLSADWNSHGRFVSKWSQADDLHGFDDGGAVWRVGRGQGVAATARTEIKKSSRVWHSGHTGPWGLLGPMLLTEQSAQRGGLADRIGVGAARGHEGWHVTVAGQKR